MKEFNEIKTQKSFPELCLEKEMNGSIVIPARPSNPTLSPSGLGCLRAAAFKLSGAMSKDDFETYESALAAEMGSFIHQRIQKFLSVSDIWVDPKKYIEDRPELGLSIRENQKTQGEVSLFFSGKRKGYPEMPPFSFQCDGIVFIDGEYYIVEIKTETETAWQKREAPNPKHSAQGAGYAFLYGIDKILWVYASRESFGVHRKIYMEEVSPYKISELIDNSVLIKEAVNGKDIGSLPKAKDCKYCAFIDLCKKL